MNNYRSMIEDCFYREKPLNLDAIIYEYDDFSEEFTEFFDNLFSELEEENSKELYREFILEFMNFLDNFKVYTKNEVFSSRYDPIHIISPYFGKLDQIIFNEFFYDDLRAKWNTLLINVAWKYNHRSFIPYTFQITKEDNIPNFAIFLFINPEKYMTKTGKAFKSEITEEVLKLLNDELNTENVLVHYRIYVNTYPDHREVYKLNDDQRRYKMKEFKSLIKKAENNVRKKLGLPKIEEPLFSKTLLLRKIELYFSEYKVYSHYSPSFLDKQHYDLFIPELNTAIDYQGEQHSESQLELADCKRRLSEENGIHLFYVYPNYTFDTTITNIVKTLSTEFPSINVNSNREGNISSQELENSYKSMIEDCFYGGKQLNIDADTEEFDDFREEFIEFFDNLFSELEKKNSKELYREFILGFMNFLDKFKVYTQKELIDSGCEPINIIYSHLVQLDQIIFNEFFYDEIRIKWNTFLVNAAWKSKSGFYIPYTFQITKEDIIPNFAIFLFINPEKYMTKTGKAFKSEIIEEALKLLDDELNTENVLIHYNVCDNTYSDNREVYKINAVRWYKVKEFKNLIKKAENNVRKKINIPKIGQSLLSETLLLRKIELYFSEYKVYSHYSPSFLGKQHYDIFIPELNTAIEYQGEQHSEPIDYFGGKERFEHQLELDDRKRRLSEENGIHLFYVYPNYNFDILITHIIKTLSTEFPSISVNSNMENNISSQELENNLKDELKNLKILKDSINSSQEEKDKKEKKYNKWNNYIQQLKEQSNLEENSPEIQLAKIIHFKDLGLSLDYCYQCINSIRDYYLSNGIFYIEDSYPDPDYFYLKIILFYRNLHHYQKTIEMCEEAISLGIPKNTYSTRLYDLGNYENMINDLIKRSKKKNNSI